MWLRWWDTDLSILYLLFYTTEPHLHTCACMEVSNGSSRANFLFCWNPFSSEKYSRDICDSSEVVTHSCKSTYTHKCHFRYLFPSNDRPPSTYALPTLEYQYLKLWKWDLDSCLLPGRISFWLHTNLHWLQTVPNVFQKQDNRPQCTWCNNPNRIQQIKSVDKVTAPFLNLFSWKHGCISPSLAHALQPENHKAILLTHCLLQHPNKG